MLRILKTTADGSKHAFKLGRGGRLGPWLLGPFGFFRFFFKLRLGFRVYRVQGLGFRVLGFIGFRV